MSVKLQVFLRNTKKALVKKWYKMMEPLAEYLTKRDKKINEKKKDKISEYEATKWIAEDMVSYIVKYNSNMHLIVADSIHREDLSGYESIDDMYRGNIIKRKKAKMAYWKFNKTIEFQENVLDEIRKIRGMKVEELEVDFGWRMNSIKNYQGTYKISIEGSRE